MSQTSPILSLPYIQAAQAQKHVTHNEALRILDAITQLSVISTTLVTPPGLVSVGDRYIVAAGGTGPWEGHDHSVAVWVDGTWQFFVPSVGWRADTVASGEELRFDGTGWQVTGGFPDLQNLPEVGINTTADATNKLSVAADATLLNNDGAGHQLKLNKATVGDTASLLFQTGFGGRAEMGTAGTDDFAIKVSADGAAFQTALQAEAGTGAVQFPSGQAFFQDVTIADDGVWSVDIPWSDPARILLWLGVDLEGLFALVAINGPMTGAANFTEISAGPAATFTYLGGVLTGTTGPAGGVALAIDDSGATPKLFVENRLGSSRTFTLSTLGK